MEGEPVRAVTEDGLTKRVASRRRASSFPEPGKEPAASGSADASSALPSTRVHLRRYGVSVAGPSDAACATLVYERGFDVPYASLRITLQSGTPSESTAACHLESRKRALATMFRLIKRQMEPAGWIPLRRVEVLDVRDAHLPKLGVRRARRLRPCEVAVAAGLGEIVRAMTSRQDAPTCEFGDARGRRWVRPTEKRLDRVVFGFETPPGADSSQRTVSSGQPPEVPPRLQLDSTVRRTPEGTVWVNGYGLTAVSPTSCHRLEYTYAPGGPMARAEEQPESAKQRGTLRFRRVPGRVPDCGASRVGGAGIVGAEERRGELRSLIEAVRATARKTFRVDGISGGLSRDFYRRLAQASLASREWDTRRGRATRAKRFDVGTTYDLVCALINEAHAHQELSQLLSPYASSVRCEGLEKLSVRPLSELEYGGDLIAEGAPRWAKVPHDAMYYFVAQPAGTNPQAGE